MAERANGKHQVWKAKGRAMVMIATQGVPLHVRPTSYFNTAAA